MVKSALWILPTVAAASLAVLVFLHEAGPVAVSITGIYEPATEGVAGDPGEARAPREASVRLQLRDDQTYTLRLPAGEGGSTVEGGWQRTPAGVRLTPERVDGDAVPGDPSAVEVLALDGDDLVLSSGRRAVHLRRR